MQVIEKDILTVEDGIICHQVNVFGVMGAGLALKIKYKWPNVFNKYKEYCQVANKKTLLGSVLVVDINDNLSVANIFSQYDFGRNTGCHTDYDELDQCLRTLVSIAAELNKPIYLPYKLGCGLAGGDWDIVAYLIEKNAPEAIICKWE